MPEYPDCCLRHRTNGPRGGSCGSLAYTGPEATTDLLATVPAEERIRIRRLADDAWKMAVGHGPEPERQRQDVITREVAAYHAAHRCDTCPHRSEATCPDPACPREPAPENAFGRAIRTMHATPETHARTWVKDARFPGCEVQRGEGPEVTAVRDAAAPRAHLWDPVGGRLNEPTEGDMLEGATMGAAAPLTEDELAAIEARSSGPGPLAGDGEAMRRLVAEVRSLRAERDEAHAMLDKSSAGNIVVDLDPMNEIVDRPATLAERIEDLAESVANAKEGARVAQLARDEARAELAADASPRGALWESINAYAVACGGDPSRHVYGNTARQKAVVAVEAAADASRPGLTEEQIRSIVRATIEAKCASGMADMRLTIAAHEVTCAIAAALFRASHGMPQGPGLTEEQARAWAESIGDIGSVEGQVQTPDRHFAIIGPGRGEVIGCTSAKWMPSPHEVGEPGATFREVSEEACPSCAAVAAADPVPDRVGPRGSSYDGAHALRASALGSMAPAVIAEASRADVYAPAAALTRERWIDVGGIAHASNCSGQRDANGRCYCGAVQPLPGGLTCPGCYAETGIAQPHREPPRCPGYAAHVTARPEDTSAPSPGPAPACCSRAGEYNGYNSDGPRSFDCPAACGCHD